jgi:hypothetical protein
MEGTPSCLQIFTASRLSISACHHRSFGAILRIEENRMPATFALKATTISLKVSHQLVTLHNFCAPAPTERGKSSIKSASAAVASGFGTQCFPLFQMHLRHIFKRTPDHQTNIG